ncbi:hypothetical protein D7Y13_16365 [Corallococcus praedator]|uniref:Uncharacterized protein n=1 Tax=Corallococcus praedator TaxID=2316724 RepID=A0ABX9QHZ2_9BACT|nr:MULTISPECIES: hypothetical protein [Corallococcus]RKH29646.1 hypothetical protein D7X75_22480 [Corallococcus sp. CA031C]RKI08249.1 hypothetical protein D7Y13_16365 [Corallococcus praedator]
MAVNITRFHNVFLYQSHAHVPELLKDLEVLGQLDAGAEKQLGALTTAAWLTTIPGGSLVLLCCYASWASAVSSDVPAWEQGSQLLRNGFFLGLLLFALGLLLFLWRARLKPRDLDNRRYGLARVLLQRLQVDLAPDAPVRLKLDLRQPDVREKRVRQDMVGWWRTEFFIDPWFLLETRLADGTFLKIHMVEKHQKRERYKTSASGKTKKKTKTKGFARLEVSLRVKPERHPGLGTLKARATNATRLPRRVELERVRVGADRLSLRVRLAGDWVAQAKKAPDDPETPAFWKQALEKDDASRTTTMMLLSLYQVVHYARLRGKRQSARGRRQSV